jgi:hypothetical protein
MSEPDITKILKSLKSNYNIYPPVSKVVVAQNFNANNTKRLLYDFLDIYNINIEIKPFKPFFDTLVKYGDYYIDFSSSGIFEKIPDNINNTKGENIEAFSQVIQTLCNNVPINLDVRGIFSGITNQSSIQEKILCKMRLAAAILDINGNNNTLFKNPLDLSNHKFNITSESGTNPQEQPKIVFWGNGTCKSNDKKLYTSEFNFKITQFSYPALLSYIYIVSVSSSIVGPLLTLLPLPDYFIKNINTLVNSNLLSPDHCIGFSRNGTYNVKFIITQGQYDEVFSTKSSNPGVVFQFLCPNNRFNASNGIDPSNPFPDVLWMASNNIGSLSITAPTSVANPKWEIQCIETTPGSNITYPMFVDTSTGVSKDAKPEKVSYNTLIQKAKEKQIIPKGFRLGMIRDKLTFVDKTDKEIHTCTEAEEAAAEEAAAAAAAAAAPPAPARLTPVPAPPAPAQAPYNPPAKFTDTSNLVERELRRQAQQAQQPIEKPSVFQQALGVAEKAEARRQREEMLAEAAADEEARIAEEQRQVEVEQRRQAALDDFKKREIEEKEAEKRAAANSKRIEIEQAAAKQAAEAAATEAEKNRIERAQRAEIDRQQEEAQIQAAAEKENRRRQASPIQPRTEIQLTDEQREEGLKAVNKRLNIVSNAQKYVNEKARNAQKAAQNTALTTANSRSDFFKTLPPSEVENLRAQAAPEQQQQAEAVQNQIPISNLPDVASLQAEAAAQKAQQAQATPLQQEQAAPAQQTQAAQPKQAPVTFEQQLASRVAGRRFYLNPGFGKNVQSANYPDMKYFNGLGEPVNQKPDTAAEPTEYFEPNFAGGNKANKKHKRINKKKQNKNKKVSIKKNKKRAPTKKTRRNKKE